FKSSAQITLQKVSPSARSQCDAHDYPKNFSKFENFMYWLYSKLFAVLKYLQSKRPHIHETRIYS
ncbi:unnamed protein product, partial [Sphenostylis stenocarpa]